MKCPILESKPGKDERSIYGSVRSWIDVRRLVPLRVEKYASSGQLLRRIDTTRVVADAGHPIPADLTVSGARPDSSTLLDGSRIRHNVTYTDRDFTIEGLKVPSDEGSTRPNLKVKGSLMKRLFTCSNAGELALIRSVLDASKISYEEVRNEAVSQTFPGMAADPEIWVWKRRIMRRQTPHKDRHESLN